MVKIRFRFTVRYSRQMIKKGKTFDWTQPVKNFLTVDPSTWDLY